MTEALDFCLQVGAAQARLQRKLDDVLGTLHGLGLADFVLLRALAEAPDEGLAASQLEPVLGVAASAVVRQVLALEKSGWVARAVDAAGRRCIILRAPGRRLVREAAETANAVCAAALRDSPVSQQVVAGRVLVQIARSPALAMR